MNDTEKQARLGLLLKLLPIPGKSGEELKVMTEIELLLKEAGLSPEQIHFDKAHEQAGFGNTGNLIVTLPGTIQGPRRLLMAHVDTVPLCVGAQPVVEGDWIVAESDQTALGGDDRSGATVILSTLLNILKEKPDHPPLTFLWTVQEEVGLVGARYVDQALLEQPEFCFNFDGGATEAVIRGATGDTHIDIKVNGIASHAGAHPEMGASAIVIAGMAMARLQRDGWHGLVEKTNGVGTSNFGSIHGGAATNVVPETVEIKAEARSHDSEFRAEIVAAMEQAFNQAARELTSADGKHGSIEFSSRLKYEAFSVGEDEPVVQMAVKAVADEGLEPSTRISNGGLDANWMAFHGFPVVTFGCGQEGIHTTSERLHIPGFLKTCDVAWRLATATNLS